MKEGKQFCCLIDVDQFFTVSFNLQNIINNCLFEKSYYLLFFMIDFAVIATIKVYWKTKNRGAEAPTLLLTHQLTFNPLIDLISWLTDTILCSLYLLRKR